MSSNGQRAYIALMIILLAVLVMIEAGKVNKRLDSMYSECLGEVAE